MHLTPAGATTYSRRLGDKLRRLRAAGPTSSAELS